MNENLEKFADKVKEEADSLKFKTEKQIDDFLKSIDDDNFDD